MESNSKQQKLPLKPHTTFSFEEEPNLLIKQNVFENIVQKCNNSKITLQVRSYGVSVQAKLFFEWNFKMTSSHSVLRVKKMTPNMSPESFSTVLLVSETTHQFFALEVTDVTISIVIISVDYNVYGLRITAFNSSSTKRFCVFILNVKVRHWL